MILEYHDTKAGIEQAKKDREEDAARNQAKREEALAVWLTDRGYSGKFELDPVVPPQVEYVVLPDFDQKNVNVLHDLLAGDLELVESDPEGHWMRFTFREGADVVEHRKIIEG